MILNDFWDEAIKLWIMDVVAVKQDDAKAVQTLLEISGLWQAKRFFLKAHDELCGRRDEWFYLYQLYASSAFLESTQESFSSGSA